MKTEILEDDILCLETWLFGRLCFQWDTKSWFSERSVSVADVSNQYEKSPTKILKNICFELMPSKSTTRKCQLISLANILLLLPKLSETVQNVFKGRYVQSQLLMSYYDQKTKQSYKYIQKKSNRCLGLVASYIFAILSYTCICLYSM